MLLNFSYLEEIPRWLLQENTNLNIWNKLYEPADEYNLIGTRYSGKTWAVLDIIDLSVGVSLYIKKPIFIFASMKMNKDVRSSIFQNIVNTLNKSNINYNVNLSNYELSLSNGTTIICRGLHTQTKREKLKAFADLEKYALVIDWREESDQYDKNDFSEIRFALRGAKKKIEINTCNPESLRRYLIDYCNNLMPFNEQIMKSKYEQIGKFNRFNRKIINHYSSWRMNNMLSDDVKNTLLELEHLDPARARVWSWGLPGQVQGAVFDRYLKFTKLTWSFDKILAGVDFAQADSPNGHKTSASLWVYNSILKKVHKIGKYTHSNATMEYKDVFEQANDIIKFYLSSLKNSTIFIESGLTINVDWGAGGRAFIDVLNREKLKYRYGRLLRFEEVDKSIWIVVDRVNAFIGAMISGKMTHDIILEASNTEYPMIQWKEKPNGGKEEIIDLYDDEFDSDYYALSEYIRDIVKSVNNQLIKEYI